MTSKDNSAEPEFWLKCPLCGDNEAEGAQKIPEIRLFLNNGKVEIDFFCQYLNQRYTTTLETYFKKLDELRRAEKEKRRGDDFYEYCLDGDCWIGKDEFLVHREMIFEYKHIVSKEGTFDLLSVCPNHGDDELYPAKYWCVNCRAHLCKDCKNREHSGSNHTIKKYRKGNDLFLRKLKSIKEVLSKYDKNDTSNTELAKFLVNLIKMGEMTIDNHLIPYVLFKNIDNIPFNFEKRGPLINPDYKSQYYSRVLKTKLGADVTVYAIYQLRENELLIIKRNTSNSSCDCYIQVIDKDEAGKVMTKFKKKIFEGVLDGETRPKYKSSLVCDDQFVILLEGTELQNIYLQTYSASSDTLGSLQKFDSIKTNKEVYFAKIKDIFYIYSGGKLYYLDKKLKPTETKEKIDVSCMVVCKMGNDSKDYLYIGTKKGALKCYEPGSGSNMLRLIWEENAMTCSISTIKSLGKYGLILLGSQKNETSVVIIDSNHNVSSCNELKVFVITTLEVLPCKDEVLVGTSKGEIILYNISRREILSVYEEPNEEIKTIFLFDFYLSENGFLALSSKDCINLYKNQGDIEEKKIERR